MLSFKDLGMEIHNYQATTHNYVEMILNFGLLEVCLLHFYVAFLNVLKSNQV